MTEPSVPKVLIGLEQRALEEPSGINSLSPEYNNQEISAFLSWERHT
jgi:hypothetical protein